MGDRDVHQEVLDQLEFVPGVEKLDLQVSVRDGIVTLSGHVTSYGQKIAVERAACRAKGVRAVGQELEVRIPEAAMIADELNHQYVMGFTPAHAPDGKFHTLRVRAKNAAFKVQSRRGYVADIPKS